MGWVVRYSLANIWRMPSYYELDDLVQDGLMWAALVQERYAAKITCRAHFMSLLMRCFSNHVTDLANKKSGLAEISESDLCRAAMEDGESVVPIWEDLLGEEPEAGTLAVMLRQAPKELLDVVKLFFNDTTVRRLRAPYREFLEGGKETTRQRLTRMLGYDPGADMMQRLYQYLSGDEGTPDAIGL